MKEALKTEQGIAYQDRTVVAARRSALTYLLPGKFGGFKTFINVILSLNPDFAIAAWNHGARGRPVLGAEISQNYFKTNFVINPLNV
jgi:electron transport complex protein RnfG